MFPFEHNELKALLTEIRLLMQKAQARGDLAAPNDGFVPDYWYGVATGYQDCAERLQTLLQRAPDQSGDLADLRPANDPPTNTNDKDDDLRPNDDSSLFLPVLRP